MLVVSERPEEDMILCCNPCCPAGWYHYRCTDPPIDEPPDGDWYCCDTCSNSGDYMYCWCAKRQENSPMVQCARGRECLFREFYHRDCVTNGPRSPGGCGDGNNETIVVVFLNNDFTYI